VVDLDLGLDWTCVRVRVLGEQSWCLSPASGGIGVGVGACRQRGWGLGLEGWSGVELELVPVPNVGSAKPGAVDGGRYADDHYLRLREQARQWSWCLSPMSAVPSQERSTEVDTRMTTTSGSGNRLGRGGNRTCDPLG
jgi:hypothetical protein